MNRRVTSFDGTRHAEVAHGADCVVVMMQGPGGIVLTADEADHLAYILRAQAEASRRPEVAE